jgi:hypothetical protein
MGDANGAKGNPERIGVFLSCFPQWDTHFSSLLR